MVADRGYERAESYLQALRQSLMDEQRVARELEDAASYLGAEGHGELAQALRAVINRHLAKRSDRCDP